MTEPRKPPDDAPKDDDLVQKIGHTVGEAVEKVDEAVERVEAGVDRAVEEVVEHVPPAARAPVRWTVRQILVVAILGAVLVVVAITAGVAYYLWNHTEFASHELTGRVNALLRERSNVQLELSGVSGNPLTTVVVHRPRVRFREGGGAPLLEAESMRMRYSTWDLLWARRGAILIELERPTVRLERGPGGAWRLPTWKAGPSRPGRPRGFDFELQMHDGRLDSPDSVLAVRGLDLDLRFATEPTRLELRSMKWKQGPWGSVLRALRADVTSGDSLVVKLHELATGDVRLRGTLRSRRGETTRVVDATIDRVRWAWLARVFRNDVLNVPGEGAATVTATGDRDWRGRMRARATWKDLPVTGEGAFAWSGGRFVLAPLAGDSPAGRFEGRVDWSKARWSVEGEAREADPAHWGGLGLVGWPAGVLNGRFRYAVETGRVRDGVLTAALTASEWTGWRADSALVRVHFPQEGAVDFDVRARRREGTMTLSGATVADGWDGRYALDDFPLDEWPDGRATGLRGRLADGAGTVAGRQGRLDVTGALEGAATSWFGATAGRWRLANVSGRMLPTPDLTADLSLADVMFLGLHWDSVATPMVLGDRTLGFRGLVAAAGDSLVEMDGDAGWDDAGWRLEAPRAVFRSPDFEWRAEPPLRLAGDPRGVRFEQVAARDGDARLEARGTWAGPGGVYDWNGRIERLDLSRLGLPDDLALAGRADVMLDVGGVSGDPRWTFSGRSSRPGSQGHAADSLVIALAGAPSRLELRELLVMLDGGRLRGSGSVEAMRAAWPDTLTPDGILRWVQGGARWGGEVAVQGFPLDRLGNVAPAAASVRGRLDGRLAFSGSPLEPRFEAEAQAAAPAWRNLSLDGARLRATYAGEDLRVNAFEMELDGVTSRVSGHLPLTLALGRNPELPDREMDLDVDVPNGDLALLAQLLPPIGYAAGRYDVDARVRGTPKRPDLSGTVIVSDGRMRLAGREELFEQARARLTLGSREITLDSLTAVQASRGRDPGQIWGRGVVRLDGLRLRDYDFTLSMRNVTAIEPGVYLANFDGDFAVARGPRVNGATLPLVTSDNVTVRQAVILFDFTRQTEVEQVEASTQPLYWLYRMHVTAVNNLRWTPPDADIEFSADLTVEQTPDSLLLYGEMSALRGNYWFLANRFNVQQADLTFDNVNGLDPVLDAVATTRIVTAAADPSRPPVPYTVTVNLQGRSSEPSIEFTSDPDELDEAQMLRELTLGAPGADLGGVVGDPLDSYLSRQLSRQLSGELGRLFGQYLNEIEVSRQSGGLLTGAGDLVVGVGTQINPNLSLRLWQRVPGTYREPGTTGAIDLFEREIEAEYRLNRFFRVTSGYTQPRATTASSSTSKPSFHVSLKARWEY